MEQKRNRGLSPKRKKSLFKKMSIFFTRICSLGTALLTITGCAKSNKEDKIGDIIVDIDLHTDIRGKIAPPPVDTLIEKDTTKSCDTTSGKVEDDQQIWLGGIIAPPEDD